ncbi:MAG: ABC transporter permease [Vicinamibacterales bacterium]
MLRPPPPLARRLLRAQLPVAWRDDVAENLDDLHGARARARGQRAADAWYWRQALSFPIRLRLAGDPPVAAAPSTRTSLMRTLLQDLRYAWRVHRARPGVAVAAILSLAIGIGINTAIFSIVNGVLLRPAPFQGFDRLVMVWETDRDSGTTREPGSLPDFLDYRREATTFDAMGGLIAGEQSFAADGGDPTRLASLVVSHDLLDMFGIRPILGRTFGAADGQPGAPPVVLISESLWRTSFAADPDIVGRTIRLSDVGYTCVGVVPDATEFGVLQVLGAAAYARSFADRGTRVRVDVWTPLHPDPQALPRSTHPLFMIGRLAPGQSIDAARGELARLASDLEARYPSDNAARGVNLESLGDVVFGPVRPALVALTGAVGLVLLVACANVANLLLARGAGRQREVAVRAALGAGRGRIVRQFLTESLALALVSGAVGIALAYGAVAWLVANGPANVPRLGSASVDPRALGLTLVVSVVVGLIFGVFPALQARAARPQAALAGEAGRSATGTRSHQRMRSGLVIAELALAVILVVGAGLLARSFWRLSQVDPGFTAHGVVKAEFQLPRSRYPVNFANWPNFAEIHQFDARLLDRVSGLPGIEAAAIAGNHPLDPGFTNSFAIVGREQESRGFPEISVRRVTPDYASVVGLAIRQGRGIEARDGTFAPAVAVINDASARRFFPDQDPLGHEISLWGTNRRIVGVVADERFHGLTAAAPLAVYLPLAQAPSTDGAGVLLVRTAGAGPAVGPELRNAIRAVDPGLAVFGIEPLDETVARSIADRRFTMLLLGVFALMAFVLAAIGIHGVLSYSVAQQTREIGIRLALGASPERLLRRVVADGVRLAAIGLVVGLVGAFFLTGVLRSLLFDVEPSDPITFGAVAVLLLLMAAAASYLPARHATRVDPNVALR